MLTDTQIKSYFVPAKVWTEGCVACQNLPPLALAARDAEDIERRAEKKVNLRNEIKRYVLCCERIQGIVCELTQAGALPSPIIWRSQHASREDEPSALAYLAMMETVARRVQRLERDLKVRQPEAHLYTRLAAVYFPPDHGQRHWQMYQAIKKGTALDKLFERAAQDVSPQGSGVLVTPLQCQLALEKRCEIVSRTVREECGLVDVIEVV